MSTIEYVITRNGVVRRTMTEDPVVLTQQSLSALQKGVLLQCQGVARIAGLDVSVSLETDAVYWTVPIYELPLKAPYVKHERHWVMKCNSSTDPVMSLRWNVGEATGNTMRLYYLVYQSPDSTVNRKEWLFAFDPDGRLYRLPLNNLFEDAALCNGEYDKSGETCLQAVEKGIIQLHNSNWGTDLQRLHSPESQRSLFRFLADKDKFTTVPVSNWTNHCQKISNAVQRVVVF